jgi:hypothetical protein
MFLENNMEELFTGALGVEQDERTYKQEEIGMANLPDWSKPFSLGDFPIFDQEQSYTCGAQTIAKILGIECLLRYKKFVLFSVRDIYTKRKNYPNGGMWAVDMFTIGATGVSLDQLMPTEKKSEENYNNSKDRTKIDERIAEKFSDVEFPFIEKYNPSIDDIASMLQSGHPVALLVRWEYDEWDKPYPSVNQDSKETYGHFICATGYENKSGIKYIVIEDSWGKNKGENGKRYLSEGFIKAHCKSALSYREFVFEETSEKTNYEFTKDLTIGSEGEDVLALQKILQEKGFFPANIIPTGKFYGITRQAVKDYQSANGITPAEGYFGPITRDKIKK